MTTPTIYDAFTGIGISKKKALIGFFCQYSETTWMNTTAIQKAIEYAVKETPSFGGFIVTAEIDNQIVAAMIVNKTGMEGYMPQHIAVLSAISTAHKNSNFLQKIKAKALGLTKGDIAMVTNSYGTKAMELQDMNVAARYEKVPLLRKVQ